VTLIMKSTVRKLLPFVQFIPMIVFLYSYQAYGDWVPAFKSGGIAAFIMLIASLFAERIIDRALLSINCFLLGGAAMFLFDIGWLQNLYQHSAQTTIFLWLLLIGIVTTVVSPAGFVGFKDTHDRAKVIRLSLYFLAAVCLATFVSFYFRGDNLRGFILPWLGIVVFRDFLAGDFLLAGVGVVGSSALLLLRNGGLKGGIIVFVGLKILKGFLKNRSS